MKIEILKAPRSCICRGETCKKNPKYIRASKYRDNVIITGAICAKITLVGINNASCFYCRDCIDDLYLYMKSELNTNLWAFK
jgi:hypothetical protein